MGTFRRMLDAFDYTLAARTRVGRTADNEVVCNELRVSSSHAVVEWTRAGCWQVRDLGSTNGTFLNGRRLRHSAAVLTLGDEVSFANRRNSWVLVQASPPAAEAVNTRTGERRVATDGTLLLCALRDEWLEVVNADGTWIIEGAGAAAPARDRQVVVAGGEAWTLHIPAAEASQTTRDDGAHGWESSVPRNLELCFVVSQDLEHIVTTITTPDARWTSDRAHNRVLLELAKARLLDATREDIAVSEQGWVYADELCSLVGLDSGSHLNVEIHRARREMIAHHVACPPSIIERRRGTGTLRIGTSALQIIEGGVVRCAG